MVTNRFIVVEITTSKDYPHPYHTVCTYARMHASLERYEKVPYCMKICVEDVLQDTMRREVL